MLLVAIFTAQLVSAWKLITHLMNPEAFTRLDAQRRRSHWHAAIGSLAVATLGVIAAFLFWTMP